MYETTVFFIWLIFEIIAYIQAYQHILVVRSLMYLMLLIKIRVHQDLSDAVIYLSNHSKSFKFSLQHRKVVFNEYNKIWP